MNTAALAHCYKNHRFPTEIISHAVWPYFRFCLSFRDVEELLYERGVIVTYEAIRNGAVSWPHRREHAIKPSKERF